MSTTSRRLAALLLVGPAEGQQPDALARCLDSLAWVDSLIVLDTGASEATLQLVRNFRGRPKVIVQRCLDPTLGGISRQAIAADAEAGWLLWLEAWMWCDAPLQQAIQLQLDSPSPEPALGIALAPVIEGETQRQVDWLFPSRLRLIRPEFLAAWLGRHGWEASEQLAPIKGNSGWPFTPLTGDASLLEVTMPGEPVASPLELLSMAQVLAKLEAMAWLDAYGLNENPPAWRGGPAGPDWLVAARDAFERMWRAEVARLSQAPATAVI